MMLLLGNISLFFGNEPISIFWCWSLWLALLNVEYPGISCVHTEFKMLVCESLRLDFPVYISAWVLQKEQNLASREMDKGVSAQEWYAGAYAGNTKWTRRKLKEWVFQSEWELEN